MKGLYIHIPFCSEICSYCDFFKRVAKNKAMEEQYIKTIIKELKMIDLKEVDTIYIGGGTPNSLKLEYLEELLNYLNLNTYNVKEFSIELNLNNITKNLANLLYKYKVNRLSIGVETLNRNLGKIINRTETYSDLKSKLKMLNNLRFKNINLDFIMSIPTQNKRMLKKDLRAIRKLKKYITHISYYDLIIENKTKLKLDIDNKIYNKISEDQSFKFYKYVVKYLNMLGFKQYEISNFAKDNFRSIHNIKYWSLDDYYGVGAGACGFIYPIRYDKIRNVEEYILDYTKESKTFLNKDDYLKEYIFLGLRKIEGINIKELENKFNIDFFLKYSFVEDYIKNKYLIYKDNMLRFSEKAIFIQNQILVRFI